MNYNQLFANMISLYKQFGDLKLYQVDEKGVHYRADLGFSYNPYAQKNLHDGYLYCSIYDRGNSGYQFRIYKVIEYIRADKITQGKLIDILPNESCTYYENVIKSSLKVLMNNINIGNSHEILK